MPALLALVVGAVVAAGVTVGVTVGVGVATIVRLLPLVEVETFPEALVKPALYCAQRAAPMEAMGASAV